MEPVAETLDDLSADARLALYAKGRVRGKWLMTLAYDSDKDEDDARFGGVIDPRAYYTIYADRNETRYDAASVRKLYRSEEQTSELQSLMRISYAAFSLKTKIITTSCIHI